MARRIICTCWSSWRSCSYFVRRIVYSPFGQALTGIRENVRRMHAIGSPVHRRLVTVYAISAAIAGHCRRAVHADERLRDADGVRLRHVGQSHGDADPRRHRPSLRRLPRRGRLHDPRRQTVEDRARAFWQFGIGLLLVVVVHVRRRGLLGIAEDGRPEVQARRQA